MIKINYRDTSKVPLNKKCLNKILFYKQDGCLLYLHTFSFVQLIVFVCCCHFE